MRRTLQMSALLLTALVPLGAQANTGASTGNWTMDVGAGLIYAPAFSGADTYQLMAVPDVRVKYRDSFFASMQEGIGYQFALLPDLKAGLLAKYDFGRDEDNDNAFRIAGNQSNALRGLGDVDGTVELGGFMEYDYKPFTSRLEVRQGVGGHEGLLADASVNYVGRTTAFAQPLMFGFGPRLTLADSNYMNTYYGIDATQSANSGLGAYEADGGVLSYGVGGFMRMPVTEKIAANAFAQYERLGSEAADSPLVEERGSANQFVLGMGLSYRFSH